MPLLQASTPIGPFCLYEMISQASCLSTKVPACHERIQHDWSLPQSHRCASEANGELVAREWESGQAFPTLDSIEY